MAGEPRIPCSACHGHGDVELPAPHRETLRRLSGFWLGTAAVLRAHPAATRPQRTALINRLNELAGWGLVDRRREGRSMEWRRI